MGPMHFIHVGNRTINIERVLYCERQVYKDDWTVKIYMSGQTSNTPLVLCQEEAKVFWQYVEGEGHRLEVKAAPLP